MDHRRATEIINKKLDDLGIPDHCRKVKRVPSKVCATVLVRGMPIEIEATSGITESDLMFKLGQLEGHYRQREIDRQIDIEDLIARAPA